ncbi:MAG: Thiazole synthase [Syntrophaceae bacterium PtaU1.Bin231]|nr:MAG: Thiazole synthase [Syntrophaceae bacterium PtaU1.Bin231]
MEDVLEIDKKKITNRLLIGTGKFPGNEIMREALAAAECEVATVALRRVDTAAGAENILDFIPEGCTVMINTSGARNADEAVRIARLAKAAGAGNWIKIEVIADQKYLLPDNMETLRAVEILVREGFVVFPYMSPDLSTARRMADCGAAAIMPLGSPIGTNRGVRTKELVQIMIDEIRVPVIVDAGIGRPSEACECMEMGCAAVLVNTAIAVAGNPVDYARAFRQAVRAGRLGYLSGIPAVSGFARPSSPLTGFLRDAE